MNSWAGWDLLQTAMWKNQKHLGNLRGFLIFFSYWKPIQGFCFWYQHRHIFLERKFMHSEAVTLSNFWHRGNALFLSSILLGSMFDYITNPSTHFSLIDLKHKPSSLQAFPTDHQVSIWDPHGLQHPRLPCHLLSPRVCSNSCPLIQWRYLTISSSAAPFSSCLQSFPASGSFSMNQLFTSGGQNIGASALVLPVNI